MIKRWFLDLDASKLSPIVAFKNIFLMENQFEQLFQIASRELKIMCHLPKHLNLVNLLGAVTTKLSKRKWKNRFDRIKKIKKFSQILTSFEFDSQVNWWLSLNIVDLAIFKRFSWSIALSSLIKSFVAKMLSIQPQQQNILCNNEIISIHSLIGNE